MTFKEEIIYYAGDESLGDIPPEDCEKFRKWALFQLSRQYPEHHVTVVAEPSTITAWTSDTEHEREIEAFCDRLWDDCSWDWDMDEAIKLT